MMKYCSHFWKAYTHSRVSELYICKNVYSAAKDEVISLIGSDTAIYLTKRFPLIHTILHFMIITIDFEYGI